MEVYYTHFRNIILVVKNYNGTCFLPCEMVLISDFIEQMHGIGSIYRNISWREICVHTAGTLMQHAWSRLGIDNLDRIIDSISPTMQGRLRWK